MGALALVLLCAGLLQLPRQQREAYEWVTHTLEVLNTATTLEADLRAAVSDQNAVLAQAHSKSRSRLNDAVARVGADLRALQALTTDNAAQQDAITAVRSLLEDGTTALHRPGQRHTLPAEHNRAAMDRAVRLVETIKAREESLLSKRERAARRADQLTFAGMLACCFVIAAAGGSAVWLLAARLRRKRERLLELEHYNAELRQSVAVRTAALGASAARLRSYFDNAPDGLIVMHANAQGDFVYDDLNPAAESIYGLPRERALGHRPRDIWPAPADDDVEAKLHACVVEQCVLRYTVSRPLRGSVRTLDVMLAPLVDEAGRSGLVLACVRDVTEQRQLERQLIEQAERQAEAAERERALFRNSPDALFVIRVDEAQGRPVFRYEAVSPAFEALVGRKAGDIIGRRPDECLPQAVVRSVLPHYHRCLKDETTVTYAVAYTETSDEPVGRGTGRELETSLTPVRHPATGTIVRLVGAARDVTERSRMAEELHQLQKMDAIGRLAAGVAHDFNNILQGVVGGLELVLEEVEPASVAHDYAEVALGSAQRGSHLTHQLLSYARKQMLQPRAVELAPFLADLQKLLVRTLGPHIATRVLVDQTTPPVLVDPGQLETALLNLAINAAHAMPKGGTLSLSAHRDHAHEGFAVIAVADTGIGMDAQTLVQAFEPFFTTKGLEGTGLGLSMVQGFAGQSGGHARLESAPGQGTKVELVLPTAQPSSRQRADEPSRQMRLRGSGRVLLVDDVSDVLVTAAAFLERAGFEVVRAESGDQALAAFAAGQHFTALVSDYAMPGLGGIDLIAQSRAIQPGLPAVLITGFAEVAGSDALPEGTAILRKPFQRQELVATLLRVIGQSPGPAETRLSSHPRVASQMPRSTPAQQEK